MPRFRAPAPLRLLHKDLGQALAVAQELGVPLPATATAHSVYATGIALGRADQDFAAVYAVMEHLLGLAAPFAATPTSCEPRERTC